ncbi:hypothetical protein FN846DRAFT_914301 [Sphaerosporella brunnea]|uniref:Uncharacterized protein n=1 Tax=Sphaerosporella brunnea TaxID=1250544 RepID=A0A5J5ECZ0_9PEZI|nr:hypothetical protein FN846DRAFT_914301 [Sphaerosporella brunnea]
MRSRLPRLLTPLVRAALSKRVLPRVAFSGAMSAQILGNRARSITTYTEGSDLPRVRPHVWPAPSKDIMAARDFIRESAASPKNILIVPDREPDGMASGTIVSLVLQLLGKPESEIRIHFTAAGFTIFNPLERARLSRVCQKENVSHVIVLGQGARASWSLLEKSIETKALIINDQHSDRFLENTVAVSASRDPPSTTSSLLTYIVCSELHPEARETTGWLALLGIFGDLGARASLEPPYPQELKDFKKKYTSTHLRDLVTLLNASRRTPECGTRDAWEILQYTPQTNPAPTPKSIMKGEANAELRERLKDAKTRVNAEVRRCSKMPPRFSKDRKVAIIFMDSPYLVHPLVATRWSNYFDPNLTKLVLAANTGYAEGKVSFSCRAVSGRARKGDKGGPKEYETESWDINVISILREYLAKDSLLEEQARGEFTNGYKRATGGSVPLDVWMLFLEKGLEITPRKGDFPQKHALDYIQD